MELTGQAHNLKLGKTDRQYLVLKVKYSDVKNLFELKPVSKARVDVLKTAVQNGTFTPAAIYAGLNKQAVQAPAANTLSVDVTDSKLSLLKGNRQLTVLQELSKEDSSVDDTTLLLILFLDNKNEQDGANLHAGKPGRKAYVNGTPPANAKKRGRPRKPVEATLEPLLEVEEDKIPWEKDSIEA